MIIMQQRATFLVKNDVLGELYLLLSYAQLCKKTTDLSSLPARFPMIIKQRYLCSDRHEKMHGRNSLIF